MVSLVNGKDVLILLGVLHNTQRVNDDDRRHGSQQGDTTGTTDAAEDWSRSQKKGSLLNSPATFCTLNLVAPIHI